MTNLSLSSLLEHSSIVINCLLQSSQESSGSLVCEQSMKSLLVLEQKILDESEMVVAKKRRLLGSLK